MARPRRGLILIVATVMVACASPTTTTSPPSGSDAPPASATAPGPAESALPTRDPEPNASDDPDGPTPPADTSSLGRILEAERRGVIDHPTAVLFRLYAMFGDEALPAEYSGSAPAEDLGALRAASTEMDAYPSDVRTAVRAFIARPTDPASAFHQDPGIATAAISLAGFGGRSPTAACGHGEWLFRDGSHPFRVWWQCGTAQEQEAARVAAHLEGLWEDETRYLRDPILDGGTPDEGGSTAIDFYIVAPCKFRGGQCLEPGSNEPAFTIAVPPFEGQPGERGSSSFVVVARGLLGSEPQLRSRLAHELFHVLQHAHNTEATFEGSVGHWFMDASAKWAEWHFVKEPDAWETEIYPFYDIFRSSAVGLQALGGGNEYASYTWPLFMQQHAGDGAVARAWHAIGGVTSFDAVNGAINGVVPFSSQFREFAVRTWNSRLDDAIKTFFPAQAVGEPRQRPGQPRASDLVDLSPQPPGSGPLRYTELLGSLYSGYRPFAVGDGVGQIKVDFSGLQPADALDVDVFLQIEGEGWERRKLKPGPTRWCLEVPEDAIEQLIFVLSNHDHDRDRRVFGDWTIEAIDAGCALVEGTLTVTRVSSYLQLDPLLPDEMHSERTTVTLGVQLVAEAGSGDPKLISLVDGAMVPPFIPKDSSSYAVVATSLATKEMGDCTSTLATEAAGSWRFVDTPTDPNDVNYIGGYLDLVGGELALSVVIHYPYEYTENICNFVDPVNVGSHDVLTCMNSFGIIGELEENEGAPDWIFVNCTGKGEAMGYTQQEITITGTLRYFDEPDPGAAP